MDYVFAICSSVFSSEGLLILWLALFLNCSFLLRVSLKLAILNRSLLCGKSTALLPLALTLWRNSFLEVVLLPRLAIFV